MATSITLAPLNPTIKIGDSQQFTATLTGAPEGSTVTYEWMIDDVVQSSVTNTLDYTASTAGTKVVKVTSTTKVDAQPDDVQTATTNLTVNDVMTLDVTISAQSQTITVGESYTATCAVTGNPPGATIAYKWSTGETTDSVSKVAEAVGNIALTCEVTVTASGFEDATKTSNVLNITVNAAEPEIPAECPILYVHPLPWRSSAYIWAGWWVMDAIQKLTEEGKDWKTATSEDTPYYCHLATLAKMIVDYPEVDVQESRNGRIVHRTALDAGIIY
jgi:hypothetical protein